jgi:autotransporter translocation and assembly factor TamB
VKLLQRLREHPVPRYTSYTLAALGTILAVAIVVSLTIDLGPHVRELAERRGSEYLERPLHIGRLSIHVLTGRVLVEDLTIDGLHRGDRPFFTAKRIFVTLDWWPALAKRPDITISGVEMTDWTMLVEKWENAHNFPKFTRDDNEPKKPRPFTVTMKFLQADRGQFTFEDHEAPWSIDCPNLAIRMGNLPGYHGTATFTGGMVRIQDDLPMWTNMKAQFVLDGARVHLSRIDLESDGATTVAQGDVDLASWPNQSYRVQSRVSFPRMREIFFRTENWRLTGDGDFTGTFALAKGGRRDLAGSFKSDLFTYDDYRFPSLYGTLRWTQSAFDVWDAGSKFSGGNAAFTYSIEPLGSKTRPTARFDTTLTHVDLAQFTDFEGLRGQRFAGDGTWHNVMEWSLGSLRQTVRGAGTLAVVPPPGFVARDAAHLPIAGDLNYAYGPADITINAGRFETANTHVTFSGTTAWGDRSRLGFHVTSADWQESDVLLAGIMTDFGSPAHPVEFYGSGEFDGVMLGAFRRPRVEGTFTGKNLIAFDTLWGSGSARIVVQNSYVDVTDGIVRLADSEIHADGRFSLGYPRDDGGEEIDARFRAVNRDLDGLRHAFKIDEYPVGGRLTGDFHLTGEYERPVGFGGMTIENGAAYGEPFQKATASVRFDGTGVQLDNISIAKGAGTVGGVALVRWDGTYSFTASGQKIPVADIAFLNYAQAPLTGTAGFSADGNGTFENPSYRIAFALDDVSVADQPLGQVRGTLSVLSQVLGGTIDVVQGGTATGGLTVHGTGRIPLTPQADAQVTLRFDQSSLDPYIRLFEPRLSQYVSARASGSLRITGALTDPDRLTVDATVDTIEMNLFDQVIGNNGPLRLSLDKREIRFDQVQLTGVNTRLGVTGSINLRDERIAVQATGDADLGLLQGISSNLHGSGRAALRAGINGSLRRPQFSGTATIADGRVRHSLMPAALDAINGTITFDAGGVRLDTITATMGEGQVQFGGRIEFDGYQPTNLNVTARGSDVHLRYPEGVRSIVDADLAVTGPFASPTLGGLVTVKSAMWSRRIDTPGNIFDLVTRRSGGGAGAVPGAEPPSPVPLKYELQILVPSTLRVENNLVRLVANADLNLRGTYDRPILFGHGDIERGEVIFEGQRYRITRGSIDFTNPTRIEPFFDIEAETNVRSYQQTYRVTVGATGTVDQLRPTISSDPPLPTADVLALLFSDVGRGQSRQDIAPELRALQNPQQAQTDILTARATQAIAAPISAEVGKVVEQTFGVDTFQLTPSFVDPYSADASRLNPTARVTIGKRISDRVYFTFSRSLGTTFNDQILLLEIEQSDRFSVILSRNADAQTYALELRVRHVF